MEKSAANTLFATLNRELWLVTAAAGGLRSGLIATSVAPVSIVPEMPRVLVAVARHHFTHELIEASGTFGAHLLGEDNLEWVGRFGMQSGRDSDKFTGLSVHDGTTGSPLLAAAIGWLDCRIEARMDTGDRSVYLAEVVGATHPHPGTALTLRRWLEVTPAEQRAELKRQLQEDSAIEAQLIQAWREAQAPPGWKSW
jgi:flavin reductase (DIM6/NTAB) family NADH-FMN oxidoreductase RutF